MNNSLRDHISTATSAWMDTIKTIEWQIENGISALEIISFVNNFINIRSSMKEGIKPYRRMLTKKPYDELVNEEIEKIKSENMPYEELVKFAAEKSVIEQYAMLGRLDSLFKEFDQTLAELSFGVMEHQGADEITNFLSKLAENNNSTAKNILSGIKSRQSSQAKTVVSHRTDQQQKAGWIEHCRRAKESGVKISTLDDLTNIAGYDPLALRVAPRTLKAWAKEEGIEFKPGRPKK